MVSFPAPTPWGSEALGLGTQSHPVWPDTFQLVTTVTSVTLKTREGNLKRGCAEEAEDKGPSEHGCLETGSPIYKGARSSSQDVPEASTATGELALHGGHQM